MGLYGVRDIGGIKKRFLAQWAGSFGFWGRASVHSSSAEAHEAALDAAGRVTPVRLGGSGWFINPVGVPRAHWGVIGLFCTLLYFTLLYFTLLYFKYYYKS